MNTTNQILLTGEEANVLRSEELMVDQIGKTVAVSLDRELKHLSPKVLARLEQSREMALAKQKKSSRIVKSVNNGFDLFNLRSSINWVGMLLVTAVVLYFVVDWQQSARINDIADFDTALLSDSVPPDAYADDGYKVFLKEMIERKVSDNEKANSTSNPVENSALTEAVKDASQNP